MARKTTGNTTTNRNKKTATSVQPAPVQVAPEVGKEIPKNGKSAAWFPPISFPSIWKKRFGAAPTSCTCSAGATGDANGDENQDWLIAEHEIRSRYGRLARHTTA